MNEELNQVQQTEEEIKSDDNLFDGIEAEETTETLEEPNEEITESVEETEVSEETSEEPYGLKIKYNGEEQVLDEETARTLAQKGMNYDRFYEPIERLARMNGMSVGDYLNRLNDTQIQYEVTKEVHKLKDDPKYEGVSDEILQEIANSRVAENISLQQRNYEDTQKQMEDARQAELKRNVDMFFEEYPEFANKGPDALDPKVYEYINKGYTLLEAFNKWSREQQSKNDPLKQAKAKTEKLNEENKKKSLGNTTNAGNVDADDFMNGFLNG